MKGVRILALSIPFVVTGIWMISRSRVGSTDYMMAWFGTCFFGLGIPVGLFHIFDRRPQIIINEKNIWDRSTRQDPIRWEQIIEAYPLEIYNQKFVSLVLDDTFKIKKKQYKIIAKLNEAIGGQKINLLLSQLGINEYMMTDFIREMIGTDEKQRSAIIQKYFK